MIITSKEIRLGKYEGAPRYPGELPIRNLNLTHPSTYMIDTIAQALPLILTFRLPIGELRNNTNSDIYCDTTHTLPHSVICTMIVLSTLCLSGIFHQHWLLRITGGGSNRDLFLSIMTMERMEAK